MYFLGYILRHKILGRKGVVEVLIHNTSTIVKFKNLKLSICEDFMVMRFDQKIEVKTISNV